jgi:hypothetical protein
MIHKVENEHRGKMFNLSHWSFSDTMPLYYRNKGMTAWLLGLDSLLVHTIQYKKIKLPRASQTVRSHATKKTIMIKVIYNISRLTAPGLTLLAINLAVASSARLTRMCSP